MLIKMRTDSIVVAEYTSDGDSTLRLTNKEAQFNGKFKLQLLRSTLQYIVSGSVEGDAAVQEKLETKIVGGNAANALEWKVNLL